MIQNRVYKTKQEIKLNNELSLPANQEVEIVMDVVYVNGNMVPPYYQEFFLNFIKNNENLFIDDTRSW